VATCRTMILDKTGTLTYGEPQLSEVRPHGGADPEKVLQLAASLERYSKHPLAGAVLRAAEDRGLVPPKASQVSERPGAGLVGIVDERHVQITSRSKLAIGSVAPAPSPSESGLECVVLIDGTLSATLRFRDEPRAEGEGFVRHLGPRHGFGRVMLVSGDRESEVRYLAERVGIAIVHAGRTPEEKLEIVREETARADTLYVGDGINDAPALQAATVGVALGQHSDVTMEAADAVILDRSLRTVDEFVHIGRSMRRIALQSAVGGMLLSGVGMILAAAGHLPPVAGAVAQEAIDVLAVLNALRAAVPPRPLSDF
jgi:P-type E1-E2 ATPase